MADFVHHRIEGDHGVVMIDRDERLNALGTPVLTGLAEAFDALEAAGVRVVIIETAGDRAFVAGADVKEFGAMSDRQEFVEYLHLQADVNDQIAGHSATVIAAVDGLAFGGGFELALACDMIIADEGATFGFPEVALGLVPGGGGTQRLPRIVGPNKAKELVTTGTPIDAEEAKTLGVVNRIADDGDVIDTARALAEEITENAPLATRDAAELVDRGLDASLPTALAYEREVVFKLFATDDAAEGLSAFIDKRDAEFTGS
ncbi:MAG: enoyl-CoA hydratase-related protein [Halobacteriales archaeon]|nr:enoyl-CoA hydratase-related protein [Halobacteriales archaeon]